MWTSYRDDMPNPAVEAGDNLSKHLFETQIVATVTVHSLAVPDICGRRKRERGESSVEEKPRRFRRSVPRLSSKFTPRLTNRPNSSANQPSVCSDFGWAYSALLPIEDRGSVVSKETTLMVLGNQAHSAPGVHLFGDR